jgi:hypothetical protein
MKNNLAIIVAFALPIIIIAIIAATLYLPNLFVSTDYNFIYASCTKNVANCDDYLAKLYSVQNNKLTIEQTIQDQDTNKSNIIAIEQERSPRLFLHDTKSNESREVTIEEAMSFSLNGLLTSPDGITVSSHYERGNDVFLIFDGNSSFDYYLTKGNHKKKLNLINNDSRYYYRENFHFIGWLMPTTK